VLNENIQPTWKLMSPMSKR